MVLGSGDFLGFPTQSSSATDSSWTDDLPPCSNTGVGFSPNQTYRRDGYRNSEHELEDHSFHFRLDDNVCLYGVFDGHCGSQAALFAKQRIPAEILLGQLNERSTEEEIRDLLHQAFLTVDQEYFEVTISSKLAERATLLTEMPEGGALYETLNDLPPHIRSKLEELNIAVASGTTAVVALIFHGKLYVSNVGDSRALLCCTDETGVLRVIQLSVDDDLNNEQELRRLYNLNLDVSRLRSIGRLGNQSNTRCLGNYLVKGGYKEVDCLSSSISDPVIPDPEVHPSVTLGVSSRFLLLLSHGLYRALAEASEEDQVNTHLAQMVVAEFATQTSLTGVAQAVVDKVSRMHHEYFMNSTTPRVNKRDDMTLLVRNFNFPLPNSNLSPINGKIPSVPSFSLSNVTSPTSYESQMPKIVLSSPEITLTNTGASTSTESSDLLTQSIQKIPLDANGRIQPYVDFSDYYKAVGSSGNTTEETSSQQ
ncbi:unnamed protein product [Allacma fusca]|uniref:PPM-type phosphatase domain-containing protein n=1 Tax=Allacma fusca TaxID=39272 RepID=A0A8J2PC60_9HEXA|nr:unnamed protein product [Allacma fusca]